MYIIPTASEASPSEVSLWLPALSRSSAGVGEKGKMVSGLNHYWLPAHRHSSSTQRHEDTRWSWYDVWIEMLKSEKAPAEIKDSHNVEKSLTVFEAVKHHHTHVKV